MRTEWLMAVLLLAGAGAFAGWRSARGQAGTDNPYEGPVKNVQVLKAEQRQDVLDAMFAQTRALGVKCTHCHDENDFASDALEPKRTARQMIRMVRDINSKYLAFKEGHVEVTCFTCHRGSTRPASHPEEAGGKKKQ